MRRTILALTLAFSLFATVMPTTVSAQAVTAPVDESAGAINNPPAGAAETTACVKLALGAKYDQIRSGTITSDDLNEAELDSVEACFAKNAPPSQSVAPPSDPNFDPTEKMASQTKECLEKKLGGDWKNRMKSVRSPKESKSLGIHACFGAVTLRNASPGGPGGPDGGPGHMPEEVRSCIIKTVGQGEADQIFGGELPGGDVADKIEAAGCFKSFGPPPPGPGGKAPQMSAESIECFKKITGTTPDTRPRLNKAQIEQLNKECFKGGPGGPGGPPPLPEEVKNCFASNGLDIAVLTKGPDFLTEEQKQKVGECFRKSNFNPQGPGGPGGPGRPGGPGGPELSDETRKCIEGIMGKFEEGKQPTEEQRQRVGKECFKGGPGGPGGPQGGPGGPHQMPEAQRACLQSIAGDNQHRPDQLTEDQKRQIQEKCFAGQGPGGPPPGQPGPHGQGPGGPPPGQQGQFQGQPGPNNGPGQPGQPGAFNFPPHIRECATKNGMNPDEAINNFDLRRKIDEICGGQPGPDGPPPPPPPQ